MSVFVCDQVQDMLLHNRYVRRIAERTFNFIVGNKRKANTTLLDSKNTALPERTGGIQPRGFNLSERKSPHPRPERAAEHLRAPFRRGTEAITFQRMNPLALFCPFRAKSGAFEI